VVQYDYVVGDQTPEIVLESASTTFAWQQESGPALYDGLAIFNAYGGCMPWEITASPGWLTPQVTSGEVPGLSPVLVEGTGFSLGEHSSPVTISAPSASNSPLDVNATLQVWRFHGDVNWNGRITLQDVALLIDYVFEDESAPQPTEMVGDVNCDELVDMTDIVLLVEYLFETLAPLCGNPS
jgi:hypothetical protein